MEDSKQDLRIFPWNYKLIWNSKVPRKIAFFIWLTLIGKLPLDADFKRRGWNLASRCYLCKKEEENISHLFLECEITSEAWKRMFIKRLWTWHTLTWDHFLQQWPKIDHSTFNQMVIMTWSIWIARNEALFRSRNWNHDVWINFILNKWQCMSDMLI